MLDVEGYRDLFFFLVSYLESLDAGGGTGCSFDRYRRGHRRDGVDFLLPRHRELSCVAGVYGMTGLGRGGGWRGASSEVWRFGLGRGQHLVSQGQRASRMQSYALKRRGPASGHAL